MKNVIIIGSILLFSATTAFSQEILALNDPIFPPTHKVNKEQREENRAIRKEKAATTPNYTTEQHFLTDFSGATNVQWKRIGYEEASFMLNGKDMKAFYDYDHELIGTTSPASYADLPANAQKEIEKRYRNYTPHSVILFDDNEYNSSDMMLYGNAFADADNYFVELSHNDKTIVLQVNMEGLVTYFKDISYSNVK